MNRAIYAIRSEAGPIKIGISNRPRNRLSQLLLQQPFDAEIIHIHIPKNDVAAAIEAAAHKLLSAKRRRGEWFDVTPDEAIDAIREAVSLVESGAAKEPNTIPINIRITPTLKAAALAAAAYEKRSLTSLIEKALMDYLRQHNHELVGGH